jgi:hypothetical protein
VFRILEPGRGEDGSWRKLHDDEFHNLYSSPNIIRVIKSTRLRWAGYIAHMGEGRDVYRVSVGSSEGKRPLGRHRRRSVDNINMGIREIVIDATSWIRLAQNMESNGGLL